MHRRRGARSRRAKGRLDRSGSRQRAPIVVGSTRSSGGATRQYDPPDDPREYIHRVGRTARAGAAGRALLFLLPSELNFLRYLRDARVPLNEYEFPRAKLANVQAQLERLVERNYYLHRSARDAYRSYIQAYVVCLFVCWLFKSVWFVALTATCWRSYASHALRDSFDVTQLDLLGVARSFGFATPPLVPLTIDRAKKVEARRGGGGGKGRHDLEAVKRRRYEEVKKVASLKTQFSR